MASDSELPSSRGTRTRRRFENGAPPIPVGPTPPASGEATLTGGVLLGLAPTAPAAAPEGNTLTGGLSPGLGCAPSVDNADQTLTGGLHVPALAPPPVHDGDNTLTGGLEFPAAPPPPSQGLDNTLTGGIHQPACSGQTLDRTLTGGIGAIPGPSPHQFQARALERMRSLRARVSLSPLDAQLPRIAPPSGLTTRKVLRIETSRPDVEAVEWNVGDVIEGKYEVTAIAGRGGMGVVYKVHHREWHIDMAVKTPLPALVRDGPAKARFLREAQIWVDLGLHPNLVQCWYVRELGGMPRVFVDYLAGGSLKDWFVEGKVGPGKWDLIIDLMIQACDGLGYAHERGVVHRDIKPGNMLLSPEGRLCITDFGLVKLAGIEDIASEPGSGDEPRLIAFEGGDLTRTGLSLGTPQYGAPEQWGTAKNVDARADIYALGITLFELCCGRRPFDQPGKGEPAQVIIARHLTSKAPDPRTFQKQVPDSLAELILKCLAKKPEERPQSLKDMRRELVDAYLKIVGTPCAREAPELAESRASGLNNRAVSMWDLGQPAQAQTAWAEALQLDPRHAESIYNSSILEFRAGKITDVEAEQRLREAARVQPRALIFLGHLYLETCNAESAEKAFAQALADPVLANDSVACRALGHARMALQKFREAEGSYTTALAQMPGDDASQFGLTMARRGERHLDRKPLFPNIGCARIVEDRVGSVHTVLVAPDGRSIFSDGALNSVAQFDLHTGKLIANFRGHTKEVLGIALTSDGKVLVGGGQDSILRAWNLQNNFMLDDFYGKGHIGTILSVAISPDNSVAVTGGSDKSIRLWELEKGVCIRTLWAHDEAVRAAHFLPDGGRLISGSDDGSIRVWELPSGRELALLREGLTPVKALAVSEDGSVFYSAGNDGRLIQWDANDYRPLKSFTGHRGTVNTLAIIPGGKFLLSGGNDNTLRLWDAHSGCCLRTIQGHQGSVNSVAVTPDGRLALSGASENLGRPLRLWNIEVERYTRAPEMTDLYAGTLTVSRVEDNSKSQLASRQFKQSLGDAIAAFERGHFAASYTALKKARKVSGYERDPRLLALNSQLKAQLPAKAVTASYLKEELEGSHPSGFETVLFAMGGRRAISAGKSDKRICSWDLVDGACSMTLDEHKQAVQSLALAEASGTLVSGSSDFTAAIWDLSSGKLRHSLQGHRAEVNSVAVSKDERLAASASSDGTAKVWELASGRCIRTFGTEEDSQPLCAVKFMADGRGLLTGAANGELRLWSMVTGKLLREFAGHSGEILELLTFADRPHFLSGGEDKTLRLWSAENGQCLWTARDGKSRFHTLALSEDSRFVFSGGMEGPDSSVKVWDASNGAPLHVLSTHKKGIACLALSSDGCRMLTGSEDKYLRVWDIEWELLAGEAVSALTVQFKTGATSGSMKAVGSSVRLGAIADRGRSSALLEKIGDSIPPKSDAKPKLSIFLDGKIKPKN